MKDYMDRVEYNMDILVLEVVRMCEKFAENNMVEKDFVFNEFVNKFNKKKKDIL